MTEASIEAVADKAERLYVRLPWAGSPGAGYAKLKALMDVDRLVADWDRDAGAFRVARTHLVHLSITMAEEYGQVIVAQEFNQQDKCTASCQNANPRSLGHCVCICEGTQHAGGGSMTHWREVGRELLVGRAQIVRTTRTLDRADARAWADELQD
jgi:hypothetical protein